VVYEVPASPPRDAVGAHEATGPLREIRRRFYWLDRGSGVVVVEESPLESEMLVDQVLAALAVVDHEHAQVLVGQEQQQAIDWVRLAAVADRALAVVGEIEEAVSRAKDARVRSVQRAVHLPQRAFFKDVCPGGVRVAVATVPQLRDHETGHVRGAGLHIAGRH
jgi:hypothetical protein